MFNFSQVSTWWLFLGFPWKCSVVLDPTSVLGSRAKFLMRAAVFQKQRKCWQCNVAACGWGECVFWGYFGESTWRVQGILPCIRLFRWQEGMRPISLSCNSCLKLFWAEQPSQKCSRCEIWFKFRNHSVKWYLGGLEALTCFTLQQHFTVELLYIPCFYLLV